MSDVNLVVCLHVRTGHPRLDMQFYPDGAESVEELYRLFEVATERLRTCELQAFETLRRLKEAENVLSTPAPEKGGGDQNQELADPDPAGDDA